jgi:hypothetical protein
LESRTRKVQTVIDFLRAPTSLHSLSFRRGRH